MPVRRSAWRIRRATSCPARGSPPSDGVLCSSSRAASSSRRHAPRRRAVTPRPCRRPPARPPAPRRAPGPAPRRLNDRGDVRIDRGRHHPLRDVALADARRRAGRPGGRPGGRPRCRSCVTSTQVVEVSRRSRSKSSRSFARVLRVERRERLVEQEQLRLQDEGAGEAHPLRLAGRELAGGTVPQVGDRQPLQPVVDPLAGLRCATRRKRRPARDVVEDRRRQQQRRRQHEPDPSSVGKVVPREERHAPEGRSSRDPGEHEPRQRQEERALAGPVGTDDRERLGRPRS